MQNRYMIYGCARVSTAAQDLANQLAQLKAAGCEKVFREIIGPTADRPQVKKKLERRRILERTAQGRADAKAKGVKFGRKRKLAPHQEREALERIAAGETQRSVARSYNVNQAMISRLPPPPQVAHG